MIRILYKFAYIIKISIYINISIYHQKKPGAASISHEPALRVFQNPARRQRFLLVPHRYRNCPRLYYSNTTPNRPNSSSHTPIL